MLETAHLASSLVQPAGYVETEAPPSPSSVSWRFGLCQLGLGQSSSTSDPDRKDLQPEGSMPSLPHPWPAATTAEEGPTTQMIALLPRLKAPAPCSRFWRGAAVYATLFLGYTDGVAASGLFVGATRSKFTPYLSPHSAASCIQLAYQSYVRRVSLHNNPTVPTIFACVTLRILRNHQPFDRAVKSAYRRYIRWTKTNIDATYI